MNQGLFYIYCIVSRSVKEQNKYLFNYIHKLEFLICQTHKERTNHSFKFKKLVGHIINGFTHKNIMNEDLNRALKFIDIMTPEDLQSQTKKDLTITEAQDDDFLQQTLSSSSKSLNNLNQGYAVEVQSRNQSSIGVEETNRAIDNTAEALGSINWRRDKPVDADNDNIQTSSNLSSLNNIFGGSIKLTKQENVSETSNINIKCSNEQDKQANMQQFMLAEWKQVPTLLNKESKRKRKEKNKQLKLRQSMSEHILSHQAFNNEIFNNLEICRRDVSPSNRNRLPNINNGNTDAPNMIQQNNMHSYNIYNQPENEFAHSDIEHEGANGYYYQKMSQQQAGLNEEMFVISKHSKKPNGEMYLDQFDFDNPNFMDFKKKGKKRGRKRKKRSIEEF